MIRCQSARSRVIANCRGGLVQPAGLMSHSNHRIWLMTGLQQERHDCLRRSSGANRLFGLGMGGQPTERRTGDSHHICLCCHYMSTHDARNGSPCSLYPACGVYCGVGSTYGDGQAVLDTKLLQATEWAAQRTKRNRSALIRDALREHLQRLGFELEERDREGYASEPQLHAEALVWEAGGVAGGIARGIAFTVCTARQEEACSRTDTRQRHCLLSTVTVAPITSTIRGVRPSRPE